MTIDRTEDAVHRDEQKAEHEALQAEVKRLREQHRIDSQFMNVTIGIAFAAVIGVLAMLTTAIRITNDHLQARTTCERRLAAERIRYAACFVDRELDTAGGAR